jgi:hypothetical protein
MATLRRRALLAESKPRIEAVPSEAWTPRATDWTRTAQRAAASRPYDSRTPGWTQCFREVRGPSDQSCPLERIGELIK